MTRTLEELKAETYNHDLSTQALRDAWIESLEPEEQAIFKAEIQRALDSMMPLAMAAASAWYAGRAK